MLSDAKSFDIALVKAIPAARVTEVGTEAGPGALPPGVVTLIILPPPLDLIIGTAFCEHLIAPNTHPLIIHSSSHDYTVLECLQS